MLFTCIKYQLSQSRAIGKGLLNLKNVFITNSSYSIPRVFSTGCAKGLGTNLLNSRKQIFTTFRTVSQNVASKKVKPDNTSIRRLLSLAKPEKIRLLFGVSLLFVSSAVVLIVPYGIGKVIDIIYTSPPENVADNLKKFCSVLLVIFLCGALANFGRIALMETASIRIVKRLRENLFSSVVKQEISFFDKNKTGELINRLSVDTSLVGNTLTMNISDGLRSVLQAFGGISWMLYTCPQLAAISLCTVPPLAMMSRLYGRFVKNITKNVQEANAKATEVAEERISSIRTVQAFTQEEREKFLYSEKINGVLNLSFKEALAKGVFWATTGLSGNMVVLMVFYYGGKMVGQGTITVGELSSFLVYAGFVGISIGGVTSFYSETMKGVGASSRIFELIDRVPEISPTTGLIPQGQVIGDIAFNNVFFSYPMRKDLPVLKDLSLQLPQGSVTAVVGASGSGKSTLANLMLRFYDPERGSIFLDKTDIRDINPTWLRQNIAIVSQDPVLFSSSIGENIRYGSPRFDEVTTEEIMESARMANADNFIDKFPQGLDTLVGERGIMLSGGQKQRIAIARAIIKNPRILLLDEATSALDAESEHLVQEALVRVMEGRTVMVIAHRLSTIRRADQIAVLCSGKIAELGTYDQLMDIPDGRFRKLVERQTISAESDAE